jgi:hypothetical protein
MKNKITASILTAMALLVMGTTAYCDNGLSYDATVDVIKKTMIGSDSGIRKESYGYIRFDKCTMEYNVRGTYPVGELYDLKFSHIDFSSLNAAGCKIGHDYTDFVILDFDTPLTRTDNSKDMMIRSVVFNASPEEKTESLFKALLHLGELCRAPKGPL